MTIDQNNRVIEIPSLETRAYQAVRLIQNIVEKYRMIAATGTPQHNIDKILIDLNNIKEHILFGTERQHYETTTSFSTIDKKILLAPGTRNSTGYIYQAQSEYATKNE